MLVFKRDLGAQVAVILRNLISSAHLVRVNFQMIKAERLGFVSTLFKVAEGWSLIVFILELMGLNKQLDDVFDFCHSLNQILANLTVDNLEFF